METWRCVVHGRVQGVGYRYYVVRSARELGVRGMVRNREDGAVEAILQAEGTEVLDRLIDRLRRGPRAGRVERVDVQAADDPSSRFEGFEVAW